MADGTITFSVDLDNKDAEKKLAKLSGDIKKTEAEIAETTAKRDAASKRSLFQGAELDEEKRKLAELKAQLEDVKAAARDKSISPGTREELSAQIPALRQEVTEQQQRVNALQKEWNATTAAAERYGQQLTDANYRLERQTAEAGELQQQMEENNTPTARMRDAMAGASANVDKFANRIKGLAKRVFIFSMITRALRSLRTWLGNVVQQNDEARAAMARLKGALLTLAQPILNVVVPALITLLNVLSNIVAAVAKVVSGLFGTTLKKSAASAAKGLTAEKSAIEDVGAAAEEAQGSLAGFDELNIIDTSEPSGGGGGSAAEAASDEIAPDFSWMDSVSDRMADIAKWVMLIGAGFALWKIGQNLPGILGTIATKLGLALVAIGGIALFINGLKSAWNNGADLLSAIEMIGGLAAAALALNALFGPVAAGIALVVGGLVMLVTGFRDAMNNGVNLQNTLLEIAGILAAGIGIGLLVGSWIPALIAGIAALLLALTNATGHGEELIQGFRDILSGFKEFFAGIFSRDLSKTLSGLEKIFTGFGEFFGAIWAGLHDTVNGFLDWLNQITGGKISPLIELIRSIFNTGFSAIGSTISGVWNSIKTILSGVITFVSGVFSGNWSRAWQGIKQAFSGVWNGISSIVRGGVNAALGVVQNFINGIVAVVNGILAGVDWIASVFGGGVSYRINYVSIPRLAEGAVIPPNREFMAVLGDQTHGNNIEAPEDLIRKIVREESGTGNDALLRQILAAIKAGHVLVADKRELAKVAVDGINDMTNRAGRPMLKL